MVKVAQKVDARLFFAPHLFVPPSAHDVRPRHDDLDAELFVLVLQDALAAPLLQDTLVHAPDSVPVPLQAKLSASERASEAES